RLLELHDALSTGDTDAVVALDHVIAGYQTAAAISRPDGYSAETLERVRRFRSAVAPPTPQMRERLARQKSFLNYPLLTVEEGFAGLVSRLSTAELMNGASTLIHLELEKPPVAGEAHRPSPRERAGAPSPYARGLSLYEALYAKHGYAFCFLAKSLCEANFK